MLCKVGTFLTLLVIISTACAFPTPLQPSTESTVVSQTPELGAGDAAAGPTAVASLRTEPSASSNPSPDALEPIILPLSIYILDDAASDLSSARTAEQLAEIYEKVNEIWAQAGIVIEVQTISRVSGSRTYLEAIANRDFSHFFSGVRSGEIDLASPSLLNGFYAQDIGGPNGITPFGSRAFFVTDVPSVHSERVSSHEIGHILGLHHVLDDRNRLMFPGTNGMLLSDEEIIVARYAAQGLLARVR